LREGTNGGGCSYCPSTSSEPTWNLCAIYPQLYRG
jgi:hypothetical protein